ncbi:MAG: energy-coupling factor transporter transmembrane component T [Acidimicrobiia bacterium]
MRSATATTRPWHSVAWLAWAIAGAMTVQLAPSPVYVALVIGIAWLIVEVHAPDGPFRRAFPALLAVGVVFALIRVVLSALTAHAGTHVLMTLPQFTTPRLLGGFTVGGTVQAGVVLQVLSEGFAIVGMMAVFGAFNAIASHYELVQSSPRAFHELGVVTTVALAFVPSTIESVGAVREADRARTGGRSIKRGRILRSIVPVLERGMERAVALSESMDARGFGFEGSTRGDLAAGWCGLGALLALAGAFVALVGRARPAAIGLSVAGIALLVTATALASGRTRDRKRYRHRRMAGADWAMVACALTAPLLVGLLGFGGEGSLVWHTDPLHWPTFEPLVALALVPLLVPLTRLPRPASEARVAGTELPEPELLPAPAPVAGS